MTMLTLIFSAIIYALQAAIVMAETAVFFLLRFIVWAARKIWNALHALFCSLPRYLSTTFKEEEYPIKKIANDTWHNYRKTVLVLIPVAVFAVIRYGTVMTDIPSPDAPYGRVEAGIVRVQDSLLYFCEDRFKLLTKTQRFITECPLRFRLVQTAFHSRRQERMFRRLGIDPRPGKASPPDRIATVRAERTRDKNREKELSLHQTETTGQ